MGLVVVGSDDQVIGAGGTKLAAGSDLEAVVVPIRQDGQLHL